MLTMLRPLLASSGSLRAKTMPDSRNGGRISQTRTRRRAATATHAGLPFVVMAIVLSPFGRSEPALAMICSRSRRTCTGTPTSERNPKKGKKQKPAELSGPEPYRWFAAGEAHFGDARLHEQAQNLGTSQPKEKAKKKHHGGGVS